jgi:hypothetical protein
MGQELRREGVLAIHVPLRDSVIGTYLLKYDNPVPYAKSIGERWISPVEKSDSI